ncbi:MAG: Crossover junction endodeoxyribonuclease RuvC [Bacteriovoracaceae bacterium]|nr:Crossover junction endodeoxyribonuclease RuvC [Bacteriovoracaceae bacterium]
MGIDPGSIRTGFAVIESDGTRLKYITSGTIVLDESAPISKRLFNLSQDLDALISKYKPKEVAIESLFFSKNAQSALKLGQARGVILMKVAAHSLEIYEYTPAEIKVSVVGTGRAQKDQIAKMLKILFKFPKSFDFKSTDQSDALAISLTHVQSGKLKGLQKRDRPAYWQNSF